MTFPFFILELTTVTYCLKLLVSGWQILIGGIKYANHHFRFFGCLNETFDPIVRVLSSNNDKNSNNGDFGDVGNIFGKSYEFIQH